MLNTRLTKFLDIKYPIISAPMAFASGGKLASAVTNAGGLGLIGGGYGDKVWLEAQFNEAGNTIVGCGFITWALGNNPDCLDLVLSKKPKAMFISFGDPEKYAKKIKANNIPLICQIQTLKDAKHAVDIGADIIVAQGAEAGGHGEKRATFTLVPEVACYLSIHAPNVLLVSAGGVANGRGLAASLMLGAQGVLVGSRFWAASEALVHPNMWQAGIKASGDDTLRSTFVDVVRNKNWPERYSINLIANEFSDKWHNNEAALAADNAAMQSWQRASLNGDSSISTAFVGEAIGQIKSVEPAAVIISNMVDEAEKLLSNKWQYN